MITDKELMNRIEAACETYSGQGDKLVEAVGLIVVGRLYGWRVMRLVAPGKSWTLASQLFGDLTLDGSEGLMPERGRFARRSLGLKIADAMGKYWEIIRRQVAVPIEERRMFSG